MALDNPKKSAEKHDNANIEPSNLQSEGWSYQAKPEHNGKDQERHGKGQVAEIDKIYGNQANYLIKAPLELREQYGLGLHDSSEKVYHAMAKDSIKIFPQLNAAEKKQGLESLKLTAAEMADESKIVAALVGRDRRDGGLPPLSLDQLKVNGGAAFSESERAMHKTAYARAKKDGIAIDYN